MKTSKNKLDALYNKYNKKNYISPDPLQFLYNYPDLKDREIAALIAACFAYGNVKQITKTVNMILDKMNGPHQFLTQKNRTQISRVFTGFKYRFTTHSQLLTFLYAIQQIIKKNGSLEACFMQGYNPADCNVAPALGAFAAQLRAYGPVGTLVPDPAKKSALKRLNLFLRWMVRKDEVDPGGWNKISAAQLIVPLDVHMHRLARQLGLTKRNQADMKTAQEISASFARYCKEDPIKYDFCITRFGIRDDMDTDELN